VRFECRVIPCAEKWGRSIPWSGVNVKKDVLARKVPVELARPHGGKRQSALRFIRFLDLLLRKRSVSTSGRMVGGCGRWPEVDTYESAHLGNKWTLRSEQSLTESRRDDGGRWERSAGSSNRL